jgi:hypothetical protein
MTNEQMTNEQMTNEQMTNGRFFVSLCLGGFQGEP